MHNVLQQARLQITTNKVCHDKNSKIDFNGIKLNVTDSMICGGDGGVTNLSGCHGDFKIAGWFVVVVTAWLFALFLMQGFVFVC